MTFGLKRSSTKSKRTHKKFPRYKFKINKYNENQYDVGVDNNNFTPVNLAELLDKIHYKAHIK